MKWVEEGHVGTDSKAMMAITKILDRVAHLPIGLEIKHLCTFLVKSQTDRPPRRNIGSKTAGRHFYTVQGDVMNRVGM